MAYRMKRSVKKPGSPVPQLVNDTQGGATPSGTLRMGRGNIPMTRKKPSGSLPSNLAKMPQLVNDTPGGATPSLTLMKGAVNVSGAAQSREMAARKAALARMKGNK